MGRQPNTTRRSDDHSPLPTVITIGNHDDREHYNDRFRHDPSSGARQFVATVNGVQLLLVDSSIPGRARRLHRRRRPRLAPKISCTTPTGTPALVAFHHPPVTVHMSYMDTSGRPARSDSPNSSTATRISSRSCAAHIHSAAVTTFAGRPVRRPRVSSTNLPFEDQVVISTRVSHRASRSPDRATTTASSPNSAPSWTGLSRPEWFMPCVYLTDPSRFRPYLASGLRDQEVWSPTYLLRPQGSKCKSPTAPGIKMVAHTAPGSRWMVARNNASNRDGLSATTNTRSLGPMRRRSEGREGSVTFHHGVTTSKPLKHPGSRPSLCRRCREK